LLTVMLNSMPWNDMYIYSALMVNPKTARISVAFVFLKKSLMGILSIALKESSNRKGME